MNLKRQASEELLPTRVTKVRITDSQGPRVSKTWATLGDSLVSVARFLGHNLNAFIEGSSTRSCLDLQPHSPQLLARTSEIPRLYHSLRRGGEPPQKYPNSSADHLIEHRHEIFPQIQCLHLQPLPNQHLNHRQLHRHFKVYTHDVISFPSTQLSSHSPSNPLVGTFRHITSRTGC